MQTNYSVVIPAYNAARTLGETIESVLAQTVPPTQVVVVDDGSTDNTSELAREFGGCVEVLSQTNQGPGAAMSLGMRQADTPYIASVDSDDVWLPEKMQRQLEYLKNNPECHGVFAQMVLFGENVQGERIQDGWTRTTMTIRRNVFDVVGDLADPPGMRGEMIDWIARARDEGFQLTMMPEVLAKRRVLAGSLSDQRDPAKDRGYAFAARAALLRKRARLQGT